MPQSHSKRGSENVRPYLISLIIYWKSPPLLNGGINWATLVRACGIKAELALVAPVSQDNYRVVAQHDDTPSALGVADVQSIIEARGPGFGRECKRALLGLTLPGPSQACRSLLQKRSALGGRCRSEACRRSLEQPSRYTQVNVTRTQRAGWSMSTHTPISRNAFDALSAIARFRHQRRSGRSWLVGDRRIASSTIAKLEAGRLVREVALRGTPTLVLTDQAKALLSAAEA